MVGKHWRGPSCSASSKAVPNTHSPHQDGDEFDSDDSEDEYESDDEDNVQPSKSKGPPVRKVMQAMAMPKRAKAMPKRATATIHAALVDVGVAQAPVSTAPVSTAVRRAESRQAAGATSASPAESGAPAYEGTGDYNRRLKAAGKLSLCCALACLADVDSADGCTMGHAAYIFAYLEANTEIGVIGSRRRCLHILKTCICQTLLAKIIQTPWTCTCSAHYNRVHL